MRRRRVTTDLTDQRFGRLVAITRAPERGAGVVWTCRCDCGTIARFKQFRLLSGHTKSCGCLQRNLLGDTARTHGHTESREYQSWCSAKARCFNPKNPAYSRYGGRGITMCERWRASFTLFLADMGPRPSADHELDRFPDNDGPYAPGNCRWANAHQQSNNRRSSTRLTFNGRTATYAEWAASLGIDQSVLRNRIVQYGWPIERALTEPLRRWPSQQAEQE